MTKKTRKYLVKLIENEGLYGASKILGLTKAEIIVKSGIGLDYEFANEVILELGNLGKIPKTYKEFELYFSPMDGTVEWKSSQNVKFGDRVLNELYGCYATPFWDGSDYTPVEAIYYSLDDGRTNIVDKELYGEYYIRLKSRTEFGSLEDLLTWYKHFYLPKVYEIIKEDFLPDIKENVEKEIL